jgi:hypothetical protein
MPLTKKKGKFIKKMQKARKEDLSGKVKGGGPLKRELYVDQKYESSKMKALARLRIVGSGLAILQF